MSNPGDADTREITSVSDLAAYLESGCKPAQDFTIGTEHEAFGFRHADTTPPAYEGADGIGALLQAVQVRDGWAPILDNGNIIGLKGKGGASLSLEPGGQFELSGATLTDLHATKAELDAHIARLHDITPGLGLGFAPLGYHPTASRAAMPWMPKGRYKIMRAYMPKVGMRGLDMMLRTCTVQVNLDFASEADMVAKMRVASALQPLATALFANSPFSEGKPNGLLSNRAFVWTDTDNARSGIPAVIFQDGFGFEAYANWLLDVPMYFVYRDGVYHDVAGASFRDFMAGRLAALPGERATIGDFADHSTTAFPDVRLKKYIETRGADSGHPAMILAQSALWAGIFYDPAALAAAQALVRPLSHQQILALRAAVPATGINTPFGQGTLRDLAKEVVAIAAEGLKARARLNAAGEDEQQYLVPLQEIAAGGPAQAEHWLARYHGAWNGDVTKIFAEAAF
ncbi:glutamate--cysteine ligase [Acidocella aminolytica]|uniref:Glutamate--cysteine ligase n=1 Tax=Acidocella aminolytica 101 = DSM 11237 TaxID=1120923 RepID=A0A0D6PLI7_9PROT|nr:glutamate--cysteine ligase [Acidocella aminolytica]GAN82098.1 glutamate--cysteine ligase [Acidocella aminolytica 101 = DSM 11237]GBQ32466.1 glutamate--cysteine ligase [Acidocella aminolytica 101 = DSM 11237]SHE74589.1 glutamate--cysteine ligase [Acidocella aminolytica 101 = DSM 11237]